MTSRKNCCPRPKIAICARDYAYTFFELCVQNYVGTLLEVFTNKIYICIYIIYIYNIYIIQTIFLYIYIIIPKGACVCVYFCTFYLKTVNGNDLILFASWRDSFRLGFKILTKNLWRYVNWLISKFLKIEIELGIFFFHYYDVVLCANYKYA